MKIENQHETESRYVLELIKMNITQLLEIALATTDEHIDRHYGGEMDLLMLIDGYMDLCEKYMVLSGYRSPRRE